MRSLSRVLFDDVGAVVPRSPEWPRVRAEHLRAHPTCEACGTTKGVQVHHVRPFHLAPALELDPTNLLTLCEGVVRGRHHLEVGHRGAWQRFNATARADAAAMLARRR